MATDQRQQPRIAFTRAADLKVEGVPRAGTPVLARIQNLSRTGLALTGTRVPRAGARVSCRFRIGSGPWELRGRVAWAKALPPCAGIEFIDLTAEDEAVLARVLDASPSEEDGQEPVTVWCEGRAEPIKTRGRLTDTDMEFSTTLPFLRIGSEVKAITAGPDGSHQTRRARITGLALTAVEADVPPRIVVKSKVIRDGSTPATDRETGIIEVDAYSDYNIVACTEAAPGSEAGDLSAQDGAPRLPPPTFLAARGGGRFRAWWVVASGLITLAVVTATAIGLETVRSERARAMSATPACR